MACVYGLWPVLRSQIQSTVYNLQAPLPQTSEQSRLDGNPRLKFQSVRCSIDIQYSRNPRAPHVGPPQSSRFLVRNNRKYAEVDIPSKCTRWSWCPSIFEGIQRGCSFHISLQGFGISSMVRKKLTLQLFPPEQPRKLRTAVGLHLEDDTPADEDSGYHRASLRGVRAPATGRMDCCCTDIRSAIDCFVSRRFI